MAAGNGAAWAWDAQSREAVDIATDGLPGWITGVTTLDGRAILMVLGRRKGGTPELLLVDAASGDAVKPGVFRGIASDPKAFVAAEVGGGVVLAILWAEGLCGLWSAETGDPAGPYVDLGDAPVRCIAAADVSGRALLAASLDYAGTGIVLLREAGRRDRTARIAPTTPEDRPIHALRADEIGQIIALTGLAPRLQTAHHDGDDLLTTVDYTPTDEMVALMLTGATAPAGFTQASPSGSTALIDESAFGARGTAHAERLRRSAPIEWPATARCWAALGRSSSRTGSPTTSRSQSACRAAARSTSSSSARPTSWWSGCSG
jgi:hypothetical protein